jgi:DNA-directed RNA polymerase subunit L
MIEKKEKPNPHIDTMKQRIKHLEETDPHNAILEALKRLVAEHDRITLSH